ncbi:MAG: glutathione S-transferase family protein [Deltaproteobacteria bacterium]|nr:glutathione S-transferase family protein [Deltaproteobacteria bacterium]
MKIIAEIPASLPHEIVKPISRGESPPQNPMIKLYDHPLSGNCYKVRLALSQLGVEYERINVDIFKGEQNKPEFIAINPNKKIPGLVDEDFIMWESNAILLYLGRKFAPNHLYSDDPKILGLISKWLFFGKTTLDPALARARFMTRFVPKENQNEKELTALREAGKAVLDILNRHLEKNEFLAGSYSIADIGCYPYVNAAEEGEVSLSPFPAVQNWCDRIRSQPGYVSMED